MKLTNASHKRIVDVANYYVGEDKCSSLSAMVVVGNDLYCIKSLKDEQKPEGTKYPVILHQIRNFTTSNCQQSHCTIATSTGSTAVAEHANSLTYENNTFYMATGNSVGNGSQIVAFQSNGIITKHITYTHKIYSINYYDTHNGAKRFLACIGRSKDGTKYIYHLVHLSGTKLIQEKNSSPVSFDLKIENSVYNSGNDSYYDKETGNLYTTTFVKDGKRIVKNMICSYHINPIVAQKLYSASSAITINAGTEYKFEIEGMSIYNSKKYVCANISMSEKNEGPDGIYVIYRKE